MLLGLCRWADASVIDSLGVESQGDQQFVLHKVEAGETLFSLSKRYGTSVDAIIKVNEGAAEGIGIGQTLRIPITSTEKTTPAPSGNKIKHTVAQGENLFRIAQKYGVSMADIRQWNQLENNALDIGQELVIEQPSNASNTTTEVTEEQPIDSAKYTWHTVQPREGLYRIAKNYNVSVRQLKEWNGLKNDALNLGQELIVGLQPEKPAEPEVVVTEETPKEDEDVTATNDTPKPNEEKVEEVKEENKSPRANWGETDPELLEEFKKYYAKREKERKERQKEKPDSLDFRRIEEKGIAELITGNYNSTKYLALHEKAPIGSIMKVVNEQNNAYVFVRVIGRLPQNLNSQNTVVKISKSAYESLGGVNATFPVIVQYTQ